MDTGCGNEQELIRCFELDITSLNAPIQEPVSTSMGISVELLSISWGNRMAENPMGMPHPAESKSTAQVARI